VWFFPFRFPQRAPPRHGLLATVEDRAVVIGAGIAGLAAARVLSMRYSSVTVLDRDTLPDQAEPRRGVPQGAHPHILLVSGLNELNTLFPAFEDELITAGGSKFDTGLGLATFRYGRRSRRIPTGLSLVSVSRPLIETILRKRVARLPGVAIRDEVAVSGLAGSKGVVNGVVLDTGETIGADLVVDGTGRGARSDRWLAALGFPAPDQAEVKIGVAYSTRVYRRRPGDMIDWQAAFTVPEPPRQKMAGVALPVEGDRWLVAIGGWHVAEPPADPEQLERYAKALPDTLVSDVMSRAEPLSDVAVARFPSSRRRLFERLDRLPAGYVAMGDAICSFNPIYGQGMTCAVQQASTLGQVLDRHERRSDASMARDFYAAAATVITTPWQFAVGGDFNYPETSGPRPRGVRLRNWYAKQITYAAQIDIGTSRIFNAVQQLLTPPNVLFRPGFVVRTLLLARKRRRQDTAAG
jgi:2-polyprenyl-6-methoxyphenol hydroxylase-like FAD-dependent oxidoreductase